MSESLITPKDPFEELRPQDGFHVVKVDVGEGLNLSIHCQAYYKGELANMFSSVPDEATVEIREWRNASQTDYGACARLLLVLQAIARYLNTGGQYDELSESVRTMRNVAKGGMVREGYHLSDSYLTTDNTYEHVFVKDDESGCAVVWAEPYYTDSGGVFGGMIDITTLAELKAQQDKGDDDEEEEEDEEDSDDDTPQTHQLSDRRDPDDADKNLQGD